MSKRWLGSCSVSRVRVINSGTHQRANQIDKIGAAAKFQSAFLPGTGENDPFHRIHGSRKIRAGQLIGAAINLQGCLLLFWNFFLVGQEKSASFPLGRGFCKAFVEKLTVPPVGGCNRSAGAKEVTPSLLVRNSNTVADNSPSRGTV